MIVDDLIQFLSFLLYVAVVLWGGICLYEIRKSHHPVSVKHIATALTTLSMFVAIVFIIAQYTWAINDQWKELPILEIVVWLLYDWTNGLTHLAVILAIRAFALWEIQAPCLAEGGVCMSHKLLEAERTQDSKLEEVTIAIDHLRQRVERLGDL